MPPSPTPTRWGRASRPLSAAPGMPPSSWRPPKPRCSFTRALSSRRLTGKSAKRSDTTTTWRISLPPSTTCEGSEDEALSPTSYVRSQQLAVELMELGSLGIVYPSVRREGGTCLACFRPSIVANVRKSAPLHANLDPAAGPHRPSGQHCPVVSRWTEIRDFPHLAKKKRDIGAPMFVCRERFY